MDTGAAITVVSEKFYQENLPAYYLLSTEGGLDSVRTADSNAVPVRGTIRFSIILGHNACVRSASVVVGLSYNIVLCRGFLHNFSAIIDVRGHVIIFVGVGQYSYVCLKVTHQLFQMLRLQKLWLLMLKVS